MEIIVWVTRLADLLWKMGFTGLKILASPIHARAIGCAVVEYSQNLTDRERTTLFAFLAINSTRIDDESFDSLAKFVAHDVGLVTLKRDVIHWYNSAAIALAKNCKLNNALVSLTLTNRVDETELPEHVPHYQICVPTHMAHVDSVGRIDLLNRLVGGSNIEPVKHRLEDCGVTIMIDNMLHEGCKTLNGADELLVRTLFGVNRAKLDLASLMLERHCQKETVIRQRDCALNQLVSNGVARDVQQILYQGQPAATV